MSPKTYLFIVVHELNLLAPRTEGEICVSGSGCFKKQRAGFWNQSINLKANKSTAVIELT